MQPSRPFRKFTLVVLLANLAVIVWGAYVRATGSGAGCGSHWPTCNGEIIPRAENVATRIEFTHRATSGVAFLLVVAQLVWAMRAFARRHPLRRAAGATLVLMVTEAILGAGLVIFKMVAGNSSTARAGWMVAHLMNTFALLAAMGVTVWLAHRSPRAAGTASPGLSPAWRPALLVGLVALLVTSASGAIVALGDTLFPARSLAEGLAQDFSPSAHLFIRLRVVHPILAVAVAVYLLVIAGMIAARDGSGAVRPFATAAAALVLAQLGIGFANLALLAPTALQLVHLLCADLVWLAFVLLTATIWSVAPRSAVVATPAAA